MAKRRKNQAKEEAKKEKKEKFLYKDLGDGYEIKYREKANGIGGYPEVEIELLKDKSSVKKITDDLGYFLDFPEYVKDSWMEKLIGGLDPCVRYVANVYEFKYGFALFSWTVQPDGRYDEDEYGFGGDHEEEVVLYSYVNKSGEFVTPFADFNYRRRLESLAEFQKRTDDFIWDSMPDGHELWVSPSVKSKVDRYGHYRPFYGNTIVFPLEKDVCDKIDILQQKLDEIRKDFKDNQPEAYLADALNKDTYHITLHDLFYGRDKEEAAARIKASEKNVLYILSQIQNMDFPKIKVEPVCMYNMNSTSVVLGFQAVSVRDHENLMMLYELFQPIVELKDYTPHVTLGYFRYGKHKEAKLRTLKSLVGSVNGSIHQMKKSGMDLSIELDVKNLTYQYFTSMNCYFESGKGF